MSHMHGRCMNESCHAYLQCYSGSCKKESCYVHKCHIRIRRVSHVTWCELHSPPPFMKNAARPEAIFEGHYYFIFLQLFDPNAACSRILDLYMYINTQKHKHMPTYTRINVHKSRYTHSHTHKHTHIQKLTHIYTLTLTHTQTHTHTHTYK